MQYQELKGKRLLVLGGSLWKEAIEAFAEENEITLLATGNDRSAGIFEIAKEAYDVDSTDAEGMKRLIRDVKIDGIYMGGSEPVINAASEYVNEIGLPCYCTKQQWHNLQNKTLFKQMCIEYGLPVALRYTVEELMAGDGRAFPVFVKPADGCGSRGCSVCSGKDTLAMAVADARSNSPTQTEIIEKYVKNEAVCVFYTFSNGTGYFSGSEDKYPVHYPQGSYVGGLYLFRSRFEAEFRARFEQKILALFRSLEIREGCIWIEVFHDGDQYFFNEIGFRVGGTVSIFPVSYMSGINQVATDIYYALTGESKLLKEPDLLQNSVSRGENYCVYALHVRAGVLASYEGIEKLIAENNRIVTIARTKHAGEQIRNTGTFSQIAALVHFVYRNPNELWETIEKIHQTVEVLDENGSDMVVRMLRRESVNL
jgi:hypothetical protein